MSPPDESQASRDQQALTSWPRVILLVDMNAFFASVEQRDFPELQNQPVAVTNGEQGTCIITCSYEARAFGIKTGMRLREAKKLCPHLIQRPSRPYAYAESSAAIMEALRNQVSPDIEIYSVDEAFLDVTACQRLLGSPVEIGKLAKEAVWNASGLTCSIGVSGDKTTAKYAANFHKPNGLTVIPPWEARAALAPLDVKEIWGINKGVARFLARYGAYTCEDVGKLPISVLAKRFGNIGRRIWFQCQGMDPEAVHTEVKAPKSMGHGKVMPPNTADKQTLLTYLLHMSEKVAKRLRKHGLKSQRFFVGFKTALGWMGWKFVLPTPSDHGKQIYTYAHYWVETEWHGEGVFQVQVTAIDPKPAYIQLDLFEPAEETRERANGVMDAVNERFGEFTIAPARLLTRSKMPNVIAPSWKPDGTRQSI